MDFIRSDFLHQQIFFVCLYPRSYILQYHGGLWTRKLGQAPITTVPNSQAGIIISPANPATIAYASGSNENQSFYWLTSQQILVEFHPASHYSDKVSGMSAYQCQETFIYLRSSFLCFTTPYPLDLSAPQYYQLLHCKYIQSKYSLKIVVQTVAQNLRLG